MTSLSLVKTIKPELYERLDPKVKVALEAIDTENFEPVAKKLREEFLKQGIKAGDDYLSRGFLALKQYYAIAVIDPVNMHAVSDVIDPFWHTHILFTANYSALSQKMLGHYMHHHPLDHDDEESVGFVGELYQYTVEMYEKVFMHYDEEFMPSQLTDHRLVCIHYNCEDSTVIQVFEIKKELAPGYERFNRLLRA